MRGTRGKPQLLHSHPILFQASCKSNLRQSTRLACSFPTCRPSLLDEEGRYSHSGFGAMDVNRGNGTRRNYSESGESGNQMFNADMQDFDANLAHKERIRA